MPVGEAVRVLRDVVDALAYAHARGVVHRDIKPDNVLISGQHAVVTDFGVAKAMSASTGSSSLTSLGIALGTPAYMAPEQAAADPHVDSRADLYAVGAMAYEMLSGRPPFSGMSPQQVLAAHVTLPPAPLNSLRPSVPPALNTLVMRCLEKKPADRVQTAAEMLTQLQAMATPSGGMTPTGAASAYTSGAEAALRRAQPARVAMLFALASLAMLAVLFVLRERLGLPDWVLPGTVVLLAIGLPIMLLTGRKERERVFAAATGTYRVPDAGVAKHLTWRKAILGGGLAFGTLVAIVIGYTAMRALGIGSIGTLQAKGLIKDRQPILLAEFDNRAPDSTLGPTLTEALRVDLSQSKSVKLVDGEAVGEALTRMQKPATTTLTPALARELGQREGVPAVVAGQIDPVGKSYVISAKVISTANGSALTALRETAASDAELIPAIDRLSRALRERIGESLVTIRADPPLAHVTTHSLDALRKYSQAVRLADAGQEEEAIPLLQDATVIDTSFAMAWRKEAALLSNHAASFEKVADASERAYRHRDRLSDLEKQAAIAWYFDNVDRDVPKVIAAYRAMLAIDPDNDIALNNLSLVLYSQRDFAGAESLAVRCVALGQFGNCPFNALNAQLAQGAASRGDSTLALWQRNAPHDPSMTDARVAVASWRHNYPEAERLAREGMAEANTPFWKDVAAADLATIEGAQGHIARSEAGLRAAASIDESNGAMGQYLRRVAQLAQLDITHQVHVSQAMATLSDARTRHPLGLIDPSDRQYPQLATAYALGGKVDEARSLMDEYARTVPPLMQKADRERQEALGNIAMAEGHFDVALKNFQAMRVDNQCMLCGTFEVAEAFAKLGQPDSARAYYEQYLAVGGIFRMRADADRLAATYQRLGELYEAKGDRARARDYYAKLLDLWKTADPELQPIVRDTRDRVARLSGEH
jgi:eukaryotic-like serine/threonine-protein kinase